MRTKHCGLWFGLAAFVLSVIPMEAGAESGLDLATLNVHPETKMWVNPTWRGRAAGVEIETGKVFGRNAFATVQEAINAAVPSGTVVISPGSYTGIRANKSLTLFPRFHRLFWNRYSQRRGVRDLNG